MKKTIVFIIFLLITVINLISPSISHAAPYGKGVYGISTYGAETSLTISVGSNVNISITPTESGVLASSSSSVTVTSTDVTGCILYIRALTSTDMNNLGALIPASANVALTPLVVNTWGYNVDGSNDFIGISLTDTIFKSITGPIVASITSVKYGVKLDLVKPAGQYTASVVYTAVPQTN